MATGAAPGNTDLLSRALTWIATLTQPRGLANSAVKSARPGDVQPAVAGVPSNIYVLPVGQPAVPGPDISSGRLPDGSDVAEGHNPINGGPNLVAPAGLPLASSFQTPAHAPTLQGAPAATLWPDLPPPGTLQPKDLPKSAIPPVNSPPLRPPGAGGWPSMINDNALDAIDNNDGDGTADTLTPVAGYRTPSLTSDPSTGTGVNIPGTLRPELQTGAVLSLSPASGALSGSNVQVSRFLPPTYQPPYPGAPGNSLRAVQYPPAGATPLSPGAQALPAQPVLGGIDNLPALIADSYDCIGTLPALNPKPLAPVPQSPLSPPTPQGPPAFLPAPTQAPNAPAAPNAAQDYSPVFNSPKLYSLGSAVAQGSSSVGLRVPRAAVFGGDK
jgi:hypothetical protein